MGGSRAQEKAGSCFRFRHDATAQVQCLSLESLLGSYPTYPPSIYCELLYTDSKKARAQNHKCRALYLLPATGVRVVRFCARAGVRTPRLCGYSRGSLLFPAKICSAFLGPAQKRGFDYTQGRNLNGSVDRVCSNRTSVELGEGTCVLRCSCSSN